jgi:hypothetical protein
MFISSAPGVFFRLENPLSHQKNFNKNKMIEIIQRMFFNHGEMKLDKNSKIIFEKLRHF